MSQENNNNNPPSTFHTLQTVPRQRAYRTVEAMRTARAAKEAAARSTSLRTRTNTLSKKKISNKNVLSKTNKNLLKFAKTKDRTAAEISKTLSRRQNKIRTIDNINISNTTMFDENSNNVPITKRLNRKTKIIDDIDLFNTDLYKEKDYNVLRAELTTTVKNTFQKVEDIINSNKHKLTPTIINKESNFVVITYWWGGDNINLNTQDPCEIEYKQRREENKKRRAKGEPLKPIKPIKKKAITYRRMIKGWIANMKDWDCNYLVEEYPEFAKPGGYQLAINAKPMFIKKALESCNGRSVVYIDGDMFFRTYPYMFDMKNVDYMARGWTIDPRTNEKYLNNNVSYDNYIFETSGGIMFFGYTLGAFAILDKFIKLTKSVSNYGKADDRIISMLVNQDAMLARYNIIQLPVEYLWLTIAYEEFIKEEDRGKIVCEHPACLTEEDVATEQGAHSDRQPRAYGNFIDNKIDHNSHSGILYERIFFEDVGLHMDKAAQTFAKYFEYMRNINTQYIKHFKVKIAPFYLIDMYRNTKRKKKDNSGTIESKVIQYYDKNTAYLANKNIRFSTDPIFLLDPRLNHSSMINMTRPDMKYSKKNKLDNCIILDSSKLYSNMIVPKVLSLLKQGKDVLYIPINLNTNIDIIVINEMITNRPNDIELMTFTTDDYEWNNMEQYKPKMLINTPFFFSHNSTILYHLIAMCENIEKDFNNHFNSGFMFVTRIRCMWLSIDLDDEIFKHIPSNSQSSIRRKNRTNTLTRLTNKKNTLSKNTNTKNTSTKNTSKKTKRTSTRPRSHSNIY